MLTLSPPRFLDPLNPTFFYSPNLLIFNALENNLNKNLNFNISLTLLYIFCTRFVIELQRELNILTTIQHLNR